MHFRQDDDGILRLRVMDADGTNVTRSTGTDNTGDFNPARWSPDGSRILYTRSTADRHSWRRFPVTGGRTRPPRARKRLAGGRRCLVTRRELDRIHARGLERLDGDLTFEVWVMNADGSDGHQLAARQKRERRGTGVVARRKQGRVHRDLERDLSKRRRSLRDRRRVGEITEVLRGTATGRRHENRPIWMPDGNTLLVMTQTT